jgi:rhodanese-related sulfurtransferase
VRRSTPYLDVRTPEEYGGGHAPGAVNVPLMFAGAGGMSPNPAFLASAQAAMPDKSKPLLVGCKAGPRSGKACAALADAGYTAIMDVQGGWMAWEAAGLPVQK